MPDTRTALLDEATTLIRTRGYSGFSYADLAAAIGIRTASIHYHFPTKEELVTELVTSYSKKFFAGLQGIERGEGKAFLALENYRAIYRGSLSEGLACLCGMCAAEAELVPERVRLKVTDFLTTNIHWLTSVMVDGQRSGEIRADLDATSMAYAVLANCQGALMVARAARDTDMFDQAVTATLEGMRPLTRP